jgi:hypothetical protein
MLAIVIALGSPYIQLPLESTTGIRKRLVFFQFPLITLFDSFFPWHCEFK